MEEKNFFNMTKEERRAKYQSPLQKENPQGKLDRAISEYKTQHPDEKNPVFIAKNIIPTIFPDYTISKYSSPEECETKVQLCIKELINANRQTCIYICSYYFFPIIREKVTSSTKYISAIEAIKQNRLFNYTTIPEYNHLIEFTKKISHVLLILCTEQNQAIQNTLQTPSPAAKKYLQSTEGQEKIIAALKINSKATPDVSDIQFFKEMGEDFQRKIKQAMNYSFRR